MKIYTEKDAEPAVLESRKIVVAGYGNQGRAQALNLRDSGFGVTVAARRGGRGWGQAEEDGFRVLELREAAVEADVFIMLLPDEVQGKVFRDSIEGCLRRGSTLCFAHGFAVAFGEIEAEGLDVVLVAPKGQGKRLRGAFLEGSGLPCMLAVERDFSGAALRTALAVAWGLGCLRVGGFGTTFREEALSDLFGEQAVLCGGVPALIKCAFDILLEKGFSPEVAYFECFHELKIIVDLFSERGFSGMRDLISATAAYGSLRYGEELITPDTKEAMRRLFERIESGDFARSWLEAARSGDGELGGLREKERLLLIEEVGERIRSMFPGEGVESKASHREDEDAS